MQYNYSIHIYAENEDEEEFRTVIPLSEKNDLNIDAFPWIIPELNKTIDKIKRKIEILEKDTK